MPCGWLSLDAMDVSGELELDVDHDIFRKRLNAAGAPLDDGEKHEVRQFEGYEDSKGHSRTHWRKRHLPQTPQRRRRAAGRRREARGDGNSRGLRIRGQVSQTNHWRNSSRAGARSLSRQHGGGWRYIEFCTRSAWFLVRRWGPSWRRSRPAQATMAPPTAAPAMARSRTSTSAATPATRCADARLLLSCSCVR